MTESEYTALVADRLRRWTGFLAERRATPVLLLGLSAGPDSEMHVAVCEDVSNGQIRAMLMQALTFLSAGESSAASPLPQDRMDVALAQMAVTLAADPLDRDIQIQASLRSLQIVMPLAAIRGWTDQQRWDAEQWARRMRVRRAEPADVPARPDFLIGRSI